MKNSYESLIEEIRRVVGPWQQAKGEIEQAFVKLDFQLFSDFCPKSHYKSECEPAYCSLRITKTCRYIEKRSAILSQLRDEGIEILDVD